MLLELLLELAAFGSSSSARRCLCQHQPRVLTVCLLRPLSRGSLRLASKDPADAPLIDPNFLADRDESGKSVMDEGLWRYSRHPNYSGNATLWFGIWLIALESGSAWWTVIGPIVMTFFLLKVSGVALTEKNVKKTRPGYAEYIERTSAFIPLPPKR